MRHLNTLRARLVLWTMLVNVILLSLLSGLAWLVLRQSQNRQLNDTLQLSTAQLVASVDVVNGRLTVPDADTVALTERGVFAWLIDASDHVNATVGRAAGWPVPAIGPNNTRDLQLAPSENMRLYRTRLGENGGSVVVGASLRPLEQSAQTFALMLGIAVPLELVLSAVGGLFLAGRALAPIATITAQAQRIHQYSLSERLALTGPRDEVRELARTFDDMLDRLQAAFESERRFTADASHELRTPLSLLKAQLSLALSRPRDAQTLEQMMNAMNGDVDRMTRLVENMLELARTEAPLECHRPVALYDLLAALLQQMQAVARDRSIILALETPMASEAVVMGDSDRITQLFLNLLDNAMKYSNEGGTVKVGVSPITDDGASGWAIAIADNGVGIAPEHLAHLFDRFSRVDVSRSRRTGGTGLGLSIARAIARQHGGHISVESQLGHGSTFTVWLPAQALIAD